MEEVIEKLYQIKNTHQYAWWDTLYNTIIELEPKNIIEFGCGGGLTSSIMGTALKNLNNRGFIKSFDSNIESIERGKRAIELLNLDNVQYFHYNFFDYEFKDDFDLIYFDIDNTGWKLIELYNKLKNAGIKNKHIIFEGGGEERDRTPQMFHNDITHPHHELKTCNCKFTENTLKNSMINVKDYLNYDVLDERFPSLSHFYLSESILEKKIFDFRKLL